MDLIDVADLTLAFTRRKRFEAKLLAQELASMLNLGQTAVSTTDSHSSDHIHPDTMFSEMGVVIQ